MTKPELAAYEAHLKAYRDNYAVMTTAVNEGVRRGRTERDIEIALNMKAKGFDVATIAEMTGLSSAEIERLN